MATFRQFRTKENIAINYRDYGVINIPKGTLVNNKTAVGFSDSDNDLMVAEFGWIKENHHTIAEFLTFDASHRGIRIKRELLEAI